MGEVILLTQRFNVSCVGRLVILLIAVTIDLTLPTKVTTTGPPQANICMVGSGSSATPWFPPSQPQWSSPSWCFPTLPSSGWTNPFVGSPPQQAPMPSSSTASAPSQAYVTTPETVVDNSWYPDSGATHHLTNSASSIGDTGSFKGPGM